MAGSLTLLKTWEVSQVTPKSSGVNQGTLNLQHIIPRKGTWRESSKCPEALGLQSAHSQTRLCLEGCWSTHYVELISNFKDCTAMWNQISLLFEGGGGGMLDILIWKTKSFSGPLNHFYYFLGILLLKTLQLFTIMIGNHRSHFEGSRIVTSV